MDDIHIDPDGRKWRKTTGYNGHLRQPDGRMVYDVHTGQGRRSIWEQVIPPLTCDGCGDPLPWDYHAARNHRRDCEGEAA